MSMDRLPPIVSGLRHLEDSLPRSLVLFLQSAPPKTVLTAFQADCDVRDTTWLSSEAQAYAVEWFVLHPVVKKYPPRRRMVRALLKAYITAVEEHQYVAEKPLSSASSEDPVCMDLMEEFIRVSVAGDSNEHELCFKTFYNPYVSKPETPSAVSTTIALPAPPSGPPMSLNAAVAFTPQPPPPPLPSAPSFAPLTPSHSSPTRLQPATPQSGAPAARLARISLDLHVSSAPHALQSRSETVRPVSPHGAGPSTSSAASGTAPRTRITGPDATEDFMPMMAVRSSPSTPPKRLSPRLLPPHSLSPQTPSMPAAGAAAAAAVTATVAASGVGAVSLDHFSALRVSTEQFTNVGLSLWPAAFVLVQLLAQELSGETHLLSDTLGLPRGGGGGNTGSGANGSGGAAATASGPSSLPLLTPAHGLHSHSPSAPTTLSNVLPPGPKHNRSPHHSSSSAMTSVGNSGSHTTGTKCTKPHSSQLRILELGAGAGLTPVFLHRMEEYKQHVTTFLATDYQEAIVENICFNMKENGIQPVADLLAAKRGLEGDCGPPYHRAALLDWEHHDDNVGLFLENEVDVVLAADCIYDADVIPALVDTIRVALTAQGTESYMAGALRPTLAKGDDVGTAASRQGEGAKQRCCIVVQTHRQNSTMHNFFSAVRVFGQVRSYTLVRQPAGTLRLSSDNSGIDGGAVPLGAWDRQTTVLHPERVVCALVPDVVLEDGSMRHASAAARRGKNPKATAGTAATGTDRAPSLSPAATPRRPSYGAGAPPSSSAAPTVARDYLLPGSSTRSLDSADSHGSVNRSGSCGVGVQASVEATEALLADEMVGPFYTSMVGLIGVHVITLRPTPKVTR